MTFKDLPLTTPFFPVVEEAGLSGTINSLPRSGVSILLSNASAKTINGIEAGTNGQCLCIFNSGGALAVNNESVSANAENRIILGAGTANISGEGSLMLIYDKNASRWRQLNIQLP